MMRGLKGMGTGRLTALLVALVLSVAPLAVQAAPPAQEGTLDPAVLAAIQSAAAHVAQSAGAPVAAQAVVEEPVDTPVEEPTEEPVEERGEVIIPTSDDLVEFETQGLNLLVPSTWQVEASDDAELATFSDAATGVDGQLQSFGAEFPGLIVFPIFESQAELLIQSISDEAELTGVSRIELEQGLPALRIGFANADNDGVVIDGAIYIIATGDNAYGLFLGSDSEYWPELEALVDEIASSILFEDELVTLQQAGDDGLTMEEPEGEYSITVPAGWYISPVADDTLRLVVGDPDAATVGALAVNTGVEADDQVLQSLVEAIAGTLPDDEAQQLIEGVLQEIELGADGSVQIDAERTAVLPSSGDSLGTIRIGGIAEIDDGLEMELTMYLSVYSDKVAALIVFGAFDDVAAQEEAILGVVDSLTFAE